MSLTKKTISSAIIRIVSLIIKGILQLSVLIFFTRFLTPKEFGIINIVTSLLVFIVLFSEIGLSSSLIQKLAIDKKHITTAFLFSIILALLIYLVVYTSSPLIAIFYNEPELIWIIRFAGLSFIFSGFGIVSFALLRKELEFKKLMYIDILAFLLSYGCIGVTMILNGYGLWSYITSIVSQSLITSILMVLVKPHPVKIKFFKKEFHELFGFAGSLTFEKVFNTIGRQGDIFTIGKLLGMSQLGIYGRANQLMDIPNQYLGQALDNVLFPAMSKKQNNKETIADTYLKGISIINLFMFPFSLFIIILSPQIIQIVFGPNWSDSVIILQILCIALPLKTSVKITDSLVRALGAFHDAAFMKFIYAVSVILLTILGSIYGLVGIAIGVNISVVINYLLMTRLASRLTNFNLLSYYKTYSPGIILSLLVAIINLPLIIFIKETHFSASTIFIFSSFYTAIIIFYVLLFHPKLLGPSWEFLLSHLFNFIPSSNRSVNKIKIYFLKKITS